MNKTHGTMPVQTKKVADSDVIIEKITVAELDSVMKNLTGVTDIIQDGKSLLHPVITLELDPHSSASEALFGSVETQDRTPGVGKGTPEPKIQSFPMVKKTGIVAAVRPPSAKRAVESERATIIPSGTRSPVTAASKADVTTSTSNPERVAPVSKPSASFRTFNDSDWKLFRSMDVKLVDQADNGYMKKYAIVLGSFKSRNNADFIKRTFNGVGEYSTVVRNNLGVYYVLLGNYDTETEAIQGLEEVTKKYTEGVSKTRRISRFGIPLDDLWILVLK
ncbi:SPOR domain-containing protein [Dysgonomonas termitidis]|uniref:SPOR domain-containing protein n=1 Tax=Dysgonomonas termitidis TaxID=1516126 RepID=UPI0036D2C07D